MREKIVSRIEQMDAAIEWAQAGLDRAPQGRLLVENQRGVTRYYWRKNPNDKKGIYLGKGNDDVIKALQQKEYELLLMKTATKEKARLEKFLLKVVKDEAEGQRDPLAKVYEEMPDNRKNYVTPYVLSDEEYARQWLQQEYVKNGHSFGAGGLFTHQGQQVRSKSEVIIANMLDDAGVPYRYEQALYIGGYSPVYPDFTVLNKRTRAEYVWEHLGAMDDAGYCEAALQKLNQYAQAGYLPGDKLLVTQESASVPLDTRAVAALIQRFLK